MPMIMSGRKASAFHIRTAEKKILWKKPDGNFSEMPNFFFVNGNRPVELLEYTAALWIYYKVEFHSTVNYSKLSILTIQFQGVASHRLL